MRVLKLFTFFAALYVSTAAFLFAAGDGKRPVPSAACAKTLSWLAKADTIGDRIKLLVSLLDRHPNIITSNLQWKRSLLEAYAHVPELRQKLGKDAASFETTAPTIRHARYVASGEAKVNEEAIKKFLEGRILDLQGSSLVDRGDLATQIRHLKQNSKRSTDGAFDKKVFTKKVKKLLQLVPLLFDSNGKALFNHFEVEREQIAARVRNLTAAELENVYGDLLKEHLSKLIEEIAEEKGLGQVQIIFENMRNQFLEREVRAALTPISSTGGVAEERTLSLESLPAWASIVRGCFGGDCSILSVPYYSLVKGTKVYFIRKGNDLSERPSGYAVSVPVVVDGKTVPYILTINGVTLTKVDVEMTVRMIADEYQSEDVVLPDFKAHPYLVNSDASRQGMAQEKRKAVSVKFPAGWATVDAYMKDHQVSGYTNYYLGSSVERAYLSRLPEKESRYLEAPTAEQGEAPPYQPVEDLLQIPLMQRAVLGAQALNDGQKTVKMVDVVSVLNLKEAQIQAARPLLELSSQRPLSLKEYRLAQEELGLTLQNLLELESSARAATLKSLYREEPRLFSEHKVRSSPKAINALIEAYGSSFPDEIRSILTATDLADAQALKLLEGLKPALTEGDLSKSIAFQRQFEGTSLETWARGAVPQAFIRMNPADTALGKKLDAALNSSNASFALAALKNPPAEESSMFRAFQEIAQMMESRGLSYRPATDRWLEDPNGAVKAKARYLGMYLNSPQFKNLAAKIPETQRQAVEEAISDFSALFVFQKIADKEEARPSTSKPGIVKKVGKLFGLSDSQERPSTTASPLSPDLILESFEFQSAPIPAEGAKYTMGSPPTEAGRYNNETQREVVLTRNFQMQATPVTQWQWELVMGKNPARFSGDKALNHPVEQVSWNDAQEFIAKMNQLDPRYNYRLPTEAEWEFMARAGTTTAYSFGNDVTELKDFAHFSENSGSKTHAVTEKRPSPWGMYDLHGNVWEWTSDWYAEAATGGVDPQGPDTGSYRVVRGGSWNTYARNLRSAYRGNFSPGDRYDDLGFRLVRTPK